MSNFTKKELLSLLHMHLQEGYARRGYLPLVTKYNKANKQDPITFHDLMRTYYPKLYAFLIDNVDTQLKVPSTRHRGCFVNNDGCMKYNFSLNVENWTFVLKQYTNTVTIYMLLFLYLLEHGSYSFDTSGSVFTITLDVNNPETTRFAREVKSGNTFYHIPKQIYKYEVNGVEVPIISLNIYNPILTLFNYREL